MRGEETRRDETKRDETRRDEMRPSLTLVRTSLEREEGQEDIFRCGCSLKEVRSSRALKLAFDHVRSTLGD